MRCFPHNAGVIARSKMFEDVDAKLRSAGIDVDARRKVKTLSIGERQMVEIAKAVMLEARVIALDEPTSSLSSRESEILFALIDRLCAEGKIIIYVSHRMDEIFRLCDSMAVLRDGKLAAHHPTLKGVTRDQIVAEMVGREISDIWGYRPRKTGEVRLKVEGISGASLRWPASFEARVKSWASSVLSGRAVPSSCDSSMALTRATAAHSSSTARQSAQAILMA